MSTAPVAGEPNVGLIIREREPLNLEYPFDQLDEFLTPNDLFYIRRVLEGRYLDRADPEKGRFRAFILTSLKFFVADEDDRQRARKRGGGMLYHLNSRPAKSATNTSRLTMKHRSGFSSGVGRSRCSTESLRNCGPSSCNTAT
jgi:hypothetical protein